MSIPGYDDWKLMSPDQETPYTEGRLAGYRNAPSDNPYRRGIDALYTAEMIVWAQQWDDGYLFGQHQAHDDLVARRLEACR